MFVPPGLVTVNEIVFDPVVEYETVCGPTVFAVAGVAPDPKFHAYEVIPELELFVNVV